MEFASYLAGEKWSDHPQCTHPGLAHLARMVNDCTSDEHRATLAPLIPSVIGLTTDDPRLDLILALRASAAAIPVAAEERQRSLSVGALVWADTLERTGGSGSVDIAEHLEKAFASAPLAERWARHFVASNLGRISGASTARQSHEIIATAVDGIARACVSDTDERLARLLSDSIQAATDFINEAEAIPLVTPAPQPRASMWMSRIG